MNHSQLCGLVHRNHFRCASLKLQHLFCLRPSVTDVKTLLCVALKINHLEYYGLNVRCNCTWLVCKDLKYVDIKAITLSNPIVQIILLLLSVNMIVFERNCRPGIT